MDIILHHYPQSPFSEKIRVAFAYKGLPWRSVIIPPIMPKPNLTPLTGGYRKTPVMQIGQHIYCDTLLMTKVLDQLAAEKPLFPTDKGLAVEALSMWADTELFMNTPPLVFRAPGAANLMASFPPDTLANFMNDRADMMKGGTTQPPSGSDAHRYVQSYVHKLEEELTNAGPNLMGEETTAADLSVYHCLWFMDQVDLLESLLEPYPAIKDWFAKIKAIGTGDSSELSDVDALEIAKSSDNEITPLGEAISLIKLNPGDSVVVASRDYARDPIAGELVAATTEEIIIKRSSPESGEVYVHFPQWNFDLKRAES